MGFLADKKRIVISGIVITLSFSLTSFAFSLEVKVGAVLSMTGVLASYGQDAKNGIDLALSEMGSAEPKLKIIIEDTQSTPTESAKAINKLITSDKVSVAIGDMTSSNTIAAASIAERAKIPIISPSATNDSITLGKNIFFVLVLLIVFKVL